VDTRRSSAYAVNSVAQVAAFQAVSASTCSLDYDYFSGYIRELPGASPKVCRPTPKMFRLAL